MKTSFDPATVVATTQPGNKPVNLDKLINGVQLEPGTKSLTIKYEGVNDIKQVNIKKSGLTIDAVEAGFEEAKPVSLNSVAIVSTV